MKIHASGKGHLEAKHILHPIDMGWEVTERIYTRHCFRTEQLIAAGKRA